VTAWKGANGVAEGVAVGVGVAARVAVGIGVVGRGVGRIVSWSGMGERFAIGVAAGAVWQAARIIKSEMTGSGANRLLIVFSWKDSFPFYPMPIPPG
jgi:hypothetical protein